MAKEKSPVEDYLLKLPTGVRAQMQKLREAIRAAAPEVVEGFGYGMPAFALDGKNFIWYGGWKNHVSFYPVSDATYSGEGIGGIRDGGQSNDSI